MHTGHIISQFFPLTVSFPELRPGFSVHYVVHWVTVYAI